MQVSSWGLDPIHEHSKLGRDFDLALQCWQDEEDAQQVGRIQLKKGIAGMGKGQDHRGRANAWRSHQGNINQRGHFGKTLLMVIILDPCLHFVYSP